MINIKSKYRPVLFCLLLIMQACNANELQIVINREAVVEVVLPAIPSALERKSAAVLQDYVKRITGAHLPVVSMPSGKMSHYIFIGEAAKEAYEGKIESLKAEGYDIRADNGNLFVSGGSGKGLLYGVYELIEQQFGARKYNEEMAITPHKNNISLASTLHMRHEPEILYRESYYPASADSEYLDWHHLHRFEDLWGLWGHSFFKIVSPESYFDEHPEYFAWNNGRREPTQLCLTNPKVKQLFISFFKNAMADNPDATYWSIAPMDGKGYCTCEKCARIDSEEGGPQGTLIRFVNDIAANFPEQNFTTLAYGYTAEAPKHTKPNKNVYIMLSTIDAKRHHDLASEPSAAAFRRQLQQWSKMTPNLFVWDYTIQFTGYLSPFPMYDHYQTNIQYLYKHGIKGIFEQGSGAAISDMSTYTSYLQAKILWNPSINVTDVAGDFLRGYYGQAAAAVKQYINQLITARKESKTQLDIYGNPMGHRKDFLAPSRIDQYKKSLEEGLKKTIGNDVFTNRINKLKLGLEYVELEQAKSFGTKPFGYLMHSESGSLRVKPGWPDRVNQFANNAQNMGVTQFTETGITVKDYLNSWSALLRRPDRPSMVYGASANFSHPFVQEYPANGPATLTDGLLGDMDYSYNWLLFGDSLITITIPIQKERTPSRLRTEFLLDPKHYIFLPDKISAEGSIDGKVYFPMAEKTIQTPVGKAETLIQPIELPLTQKPIRYLRLAVKVPGKLPDWFEGSRIRRPLIAIDEISVE